jgi:DNA-binding response OmpR family regulator
MFSGASKTVLLVDDDDMVREFTALCLAQAKFNVIKARSGEEALRLYEQRRNEIGLVVTDMVMPGLFGDRLAARLWEQDQTLPILFISGNPPDGLEPGVTLEPGKNYVRKPFTVTELLATLGEVLANATKRGEADGHSGI